MISFFCLNTFNNLKILLVFAEREIFDEPFYYEIFAPAIFLKHFHSFTIFHPFKITETIEKLLIILNLSLGPLELEKDLKCYLQC